MCKAAAGEKIFLSCDKCHTMVTMSVIKWVWIYKNEEENGENGENGRKVEPKL